MTPQALWYDDILDALKADCIAIGGKAWAKDVGLMIWSDKSADAAARMLSDCLNPDRNQRLTPDQLKLVIREARKVDSYCTIAYICNDACLSIPHPVDPESEKELLKREVVKAADTFKQMIERLERLSK
jgi:hypothetical protein